MARPNSLDPVCKWPACSKPTRSRIYCKTHAQAWRRKYDKDRCEWPGCTTIVALDDHWQPRNIEGKRAGKLAKIDGRVWDTGRGPVGHCRWHEVEHLRPTEKIEALNRWRMGDGLVSDGACWVLKARVQNNFTLAGSGRKRPMFAPEGTLSRQGEWVYARAVWNLLMGGHAQRMVLDHLTGCAAQSSCVAPWHLQPVTAKVNVDRRKYRNEAVKDGRPFTPNRCGPPVNREAIMTLAVQEFAAEFGLLPPVADG